jgi:hypothetical protein
MAEVKSAVAETTASPSTPLVVPSLPSPAPAPATTTAPPTTVPASTTSSKIAQPRDVKVDTIPELALFCSDVQQSLQPLPTTSLKVQVCMPFISYHMPIYRCNGFTIVCCKRWLVLRILSTQHSHDLMNSPHLLNRYDMMPYPTSCSTRRFNWLGTRMYHSYEQIQQPHHHH